MFNANGIIEDKPVTHDIAHLFIWSCVIDALKGWFMMGIGVKALRAIKRRNSKVS